MPGLTLSVDFWDIERLGVVAAPLADQILQRELTGTLRPGERVDRVEGQIVRIVTQNQNIGNQESRGFDFALQYQIPTQWGTFTSLTQVTYLDEFLFHGFIFPEFGSLDGNMAGRTTDPGLSNEAWYKWKGSSQLDWTWNHFDLVGTARYIDGFHEFTPNFHQHWVNWTLTFDVQLSYDLTGLIPVETAPVPGYSKDAKAVARGKDGKATETAAEQTSNFGLSPLQRLLKGTIITIGCNDVFNTQPPKASRLYLRRHYAVRLRSIDQEVLTVKQQGPPVATHRCSCRRPRRQTICSSAAYPVAPLAPERSRPLHYRSSSRNRQGPRHSPNYCDCSVEPGIARFDPCAPPLSRLFFFSPEAAPFFFKLSGSA